MTKAENALTPGKHATIIGDTSLLEKHGKTFLRFTALLGAGSDEGPRVMAMEGCLAFRNRFGRLEITPPTYTYMGRRRANGWFSPLTNRELIDTIEKKWGHKLNCPKSRNKYTVAYLNDTVEVTPEKNAEGKGTP